MNYPGRRKVQRFLEGTVLILNEHQNASESGQRVPSTR
jgi:hypothetical protein